MHTTSLYAYFKVSKPKNKKNRWIDRIENLLRVFQKQKRKRTHEEIEFHNSVQDLSFYFGLLVVEKCLEKCLLVNYLMFWERTNAKSFLSILSLRIFDKPVIFLYWLAEQHQYLQTSTFWCKNDPIYFRSRAELNELTPNF